jgi:hypothetical protein
VVAGALAKENGARSRSGEKERVSAKKNPLVRVWRMARVRAPLRAAASLDPSCLPPIKTPYNRIDFPPMEKMVDGETKEEACSQRVQEEKNPERSE